MSSLKQRVLVGIALGSRAASAAFLLPGKGQPNAVPGWPGAEDVKSHVVPIRVKSSHPSSNDETFEWGHSVDPKDEDIHDNLLWFLGEELGSEVDAEIAKELKKREGSKRYRNDPRINKLQVMSKFLEAVKTHIDKRVGLAFGNAILENAAYEVAITVPPWWAVTHREVYLRELGTAFGGHEMQVVCEATAALHSYLSKNKKHPLHPLDIYVHCSIDQDLTTVAIYSVDQREPALRLTPQACGVSTLGSVDFSNYFQKFVEEKLDTYLCTIDSEPGIIETQFDKLKANFLKSLPRIDGSKDYKLRLPWSIPDSVALGIVDSQMTISAAHVRGSIFDPMLERLAESLEPIASETRGKVYIFLSGVMSECPYVSKCLETWISSKNLDSSMKLLKSVNGLTASSRGAATYLDVHDKKGTLSTLLPCKAPSIIPLSESRLSTLARIEKELTKPEPLAVVATQVRLRRMLSEVVSRNGFSRQTVRIFIALRSMYENNGKSEEQKTLCQEFNTLFKTDLWDRFPDAPIMETIMHLAALYSDELTLQFLGVSGASLNAPNTSANTKMPGWTPLHCACSTANFSAINWLLEKGADASARTERMETALHIVIARSQSLEAYRVISVVRKLLPALANKPALSFEDETGVTALDLAKANGLGDVVQILMQNGANENPRVELLKKEAVHYAKIGDAAALLPILQQCPFLIQYTTAEGDSLLHFAAESGNYKIVQELLMRGASVVMANKKFETPLHRAVLKGDSRMAGCLLSKDKSSLNWQDASGKSALDLATEAVNAPMMDFLIQMGANPNTPNGRGWAPLHYAAEMENEALMKALISRGASVETPTQKPEDAAFVPKQPGSSLRPRSIYADIDGGWRVLHIVAHNGNDVLVKMLIKSEGASINVQDRLGFSPLQRAVQNGHQKVIAVLLKYKADAGLFSQSKGSSIHGAAMSGSEPVLKLLLKSTTKQHFTQDIRGRTPLHEVSQAGNEAIVKMLLKKDHPVHFRTFEEGYTALSLAVLAGHSSVAKLLMKNGADLAGLHNDKSTMLHLAAQSRDSTAMLSLLLSKSNIMARDGSGGTPLHRAAQVGNMEAIGFLVKAKAEINAVDSMGRTPFFVSISGKDSRTPVFLADLGANIDIPDSSISVPLHVAVVRKDYGLVQMLALRNAKINVFNDKGQTPLELAIEADDQVLCRLLLRAGASPTFWTSHISSSRLPPLFTAVRKQSEEIVRLLLEQKESGICLQLSNGYVVALHGVEELKIERKGWTALHLACWQGSTNIADILLQNGADLDGINSSAFMTPLHLTALACDRSPGHVSTAELLLDKGAKPDRKTFGWKGRTALHLAAITGDDALIHLFLRKGIDPSVLDQQGNSALHYAIKYGHSKASELLMQGVGAPPSKWLLSSCLHTAVSSNNLALVELLVSKVIDVNMTGLNEYAPLHLASKAGFGEIVTFLLSNGADEFLETPEGRTALDLAAENNRVGAISALLDGSVELQDHCSRNWTSLNLAAVKGNTAAAKLLYERGGGMKNKGSKILNWAARENLLTLFKALVGFGADIEVTDDDGWSPLQNAAAGDNERIVSYLLESGVDADWPGAYGRTAMHQAALKNAVSTMKVLIVHGADASIFDEDGRTPLLLATENGCMEAAGVLLANTKNLTIKNTDGQTAIGLAIENRSYEVLRLLLAKEAELGNGHDTELHIAAAAGDDDKVKMLVECGANVNALNQHGEAPIRMAVFNGHESTVRILVEQGKATLELKSSGGFTPLASAVSMKNRSMVTLLIELGADLDPVITDGWTPILEMCEKGETELVRLLMSAGALITGKVTSTGFTALHYAAQNGHAETVEFLLQAGFDVHTKDGKTGGSALHMAALNGKVSTTTLLLDAGSYIEFKTEKDQTPLHYAAKSESTSVLNILLARGAKVNPRSTLEQTPVHLAAQKGRETALKILVEHGGDLSMVDNMGHTCFHQAASNGHVAVGKYLLNKNQSMEAKTTAGLRPIHNAAGQGKEAFVQFLIDEGADIFTLTNLGSNALHMASTNGHVKASRLLVAHGISVNSLDGKHATGLQLCAMGGHVELGEFFLNQAADPSLYKGEFWPAIMQVAKQGSMKFFELLLQKGANLHVKSKEKNLTVLHVAAGNGKADLTKLIISKGADINALDDDGDTPMLKAAVVGSEPACRVLLDAGASQHIQSKTKNTAFLQCGRTGTVALTKLLVERGANVKSCDACEWTFIHCAAAHGKVDLIDAILDIEYSLIEAKDKTGCTPLHRATFKQKPDAMRRLIARGAKIESTMTDGRTPLGLAARSGYADGVEILFKAGASLASFSNNGWAPLHWAIWDNRLDAVKKMISLGANVNIPQQETRHTPLHFAAEKGHVDIIDLLLKSDKLININAQTDKRHTALHLAAEKGHDKAIEWLILHGADTEIKAGDSDWTPLFSAVWKQHLTAITALIKGGASIEVQSKTGNTVLYWSVCNDWQSVMKLLLLSGASVDAPTSDGWPPLCKAAVDGKDDCVEILLRYYPNLGARAPKGWTALHLACEKGHKKCAELLVKERAPLNAKRENGYTPLHQAVWNKQPDIASVLMNAGADLNAKSKQGHTPLHLACQQGVPEVASELIRRGCDINAMTTLGFTPLHITAEYGQATLARILAQNGAWLNARTNQKCTPLHLAAQYKMDDVAQTLISAGASVSLKAETDDGATPLHVCAKYGVLAVARLLCNAGADQNARDNYEITPLMKAVNTSHNNLVALLARYGNLNAKSLQGWTALHWAAYRDNGEAATMLVRAGAFRWQKNDAGQTPKDVARANNKYSALNAIE